MNQFTEYLQRSFITNGYTNKSKTFCKFRVIYHWKEMGKSSFFIPTLKSLIIYFTNTFNLFWHTAIHSSTFMEIGGDKMSPKCMNMYDLNCVLVVLTFYNLASVFYLR